MDLHYYHTHTHTKERPAYGAAGIFIIAATFVLFKGPDMTSYTHIPSVGAGPVLCHFLKLFIILLLYYTHTKNINLHILCSTPNMQGISNL